MNDQVSSVSDLALTADVLVIGGGSAGTWAAWSATQNRARVIWVDKGTPDRAAAPV